MLQRFWQYNLNDVIRVCLAVRPHIYSKKWTKSGCFHSEYYFHVVNRFAHVWLFPQSSLVSANEETLVKYKLLTFFFFLSSFPLYYHSLQLCYTDLLNKVDFYWQKSQFLSNELTLVCKCKFSYLRMMEKLCEHWSYLGLVVTMGYVLQIEETEGKRSIFFFFYGDSRSSGVCIQSAWFPSFNHIGETGLHPSFLPLYLSLSLSCPCVAFTCFGLYTI